MGGGGDKKQREFRGRGILGNVRTSLRCQNVEGPSRFPRPETKFQREVPAHPGQRGSVILEKGGPRELIRFLKETLPTFQRRHLSRTRQGGSFGEDWIDCLNDRGKGEGSNSGSVRFSQTQNDKRGEI